MPWEQVGRDQWELASTNFSGKAVLNETNSGYIALVRVENTDFDMELLNRREFFESRREAKEFLEKHMKQEDH